MTHRTAQEIDPEVYRAYHRRRDEERRRQREELRTSVLAQTRAAIRRVAPLYPAIRAVHLFGSLLKPERFRPGSDVDLALEIDDLEQEGPFARALEEQFERPVDVRPYTGPIRRAVEQGGETVYEREDPKDYARPLPNLCDTCEAFSVEGSQLLAERSCGDEYIESQEGVRPDLLGTARGFGDQSTESGLEVVAAEGSETLAELRDAVLPRLISGELQVEDAGRTLTTSGA